jgi:hypothetical protein
MNTDRVFTGVKLIPPAVLFDQQSKNTGARSEAADMVS